jgi:hypothetical protein
MTDAAYPVALWQGVRGSSVDLELDVWRALRALLDREQQRGVEADTSAFETWRERLLVDATNAVYEVALRYGFRGSFLDVELGLLKALCRVFSGRDFRRKLYGALSGNWSAGEELWTKRPGGMRARFCA